MPYPYTLRRWAGMSLFVLVALPAAAIATDQVTLAPVEVTTSKIPVALNDAAAAVTVVTGDELRARGAMDLRTALSQVAGVSIAPGGDAGPASAVPALWGLREFDAFLLVVDGVPAGGAFTPALASLDLANVERIEVLKGAAPVNYGATSFVGVIHVIHYPAGEGPSRVELGIGSRGSAQVSLALPLSDARAAWRQSLLVDGERRGLAGDRTGFDRRHLLYRGAADIGDGQFSLDFDATVLRQQPGSPHPVENGVLSPRVPLDANDNPRGARNDENRSQLALGYGRPTVLGAWSTKLAVAVTDDSNVRGYLRQGFAADGVTHNADGFQQYVRKTDVYFDSHVATALSSQANLVWGLDDLYGDGTEHSANFEYAVLPDGSNAPSWRTRHVDEFTRVGDRRNFLGVYGEFDDALSDAWHIEAGVRFNHTHEVRAASHIDNSGPLPVQDQNGSQRRRDDRWSATLGSSYRLWAAGRDAVTAYANHREMFKPAVIDFGPESEGGILQPETASSSELGFKGQHLNGRLAWDASVFDMDFRNLVVTQAVNGLPGLANAGTEHFKGIELDGRFKLNEALAVVATYARHDARFGHGVQLVGGTSVQLQGKFLELSPRHLASAGFTYAPREGVTAYALADYNGAHFLDRLNTARAGGYTTFDAGIGYRHAAWELRLDGYNLSDRRDAVAASELGTGQYYLLPARSVQLSVSYDFGVR
ncbi:MAG: TonB-dependent receptor plug domain-containing protein [Xanthomonadaceae bacterium]|nr:TonB-dependent receptor plug domain-containing protein [Xanthomonadaceae bacterium]